MTHLLEAGERRRHVVRPLLGLQVDGGEQLLFCSWDSDCQSPGIDLAYYVPTFIQVRASQCCI